MEMNKEYRASKILKRKILGRILLLNYISYVFRSLVFLSAIALSIWFFYFNLGGGLDSNFGGTGTYDIVKREREIFILPLMTTVLLLVFSLINYLFNKEIMRRNSFKYQKEGFDDLRENRTSLIIQIVFKSVFTVIVFSVFFLWLSKVWSTGYDSVFFDKNFRIEENFYANHLILRNFAIVYITFVAVYIIVTVIVIIIAAIMIILNGKNYILHKQLVDISVGKFLASRAKGE